MFLKPCHGPVFHLDRKRRGTNFLSQDTLTGTDQSSVHSPASPCTSFHLVWYRFINSEMKRVEDRRQFSSMIPNNEEMEEPACLSPVPSYWEEVESTCRRGAFLALTATFSALLRKLFFFPTDQCVCLHVIAFTGLRAERSIFPGKSLQGLLAPRQYKQD